MLLMKIKYGKKMYLMYFPLLGRIIEFSRGIKKHNDLLYFEKMISQQHPEVEMVVSNTFLGLTHVFLKTEHIKFVLQNQDLYRKTSKVLFGERMLYKGLAFQDGEDWKLARKVLSKSFEFDQLRARIPLIKRLCEEKFDKVQENEPIDIINLQQVQKRIINNIFIIECFRRKIISIIKQTVSGNIVGEVITQSFFSQSFEDLNGKTFLSEMVDVMRSTNKMHDKNFYIWNKRLSKLDYFQGRTSASSKTLKYQRHIKPFNQRKIINAEQTSRFFNCIYQYNITKSIIN